MIAYIETSLLLTHCALISGGSILVRLQVWSGYTQEENGPQTLQDSTTTMIPESGHGT